MRDQAPGWDTEKTCGIRTWEILKKRLGICQGESPASREGPGLGVSDTETRVGFLKLADIVSSLRYF